MEKINGKTIQAILNTILYNIYFYTIWMHRPTEQIHNAGMGYKS